MARRPNYGFEKRQKEIEKQKKKAEKAEKKEQRKRDGLGDDFEGLGLVGHDGDPPEGEAGDGGEDDDDAPA